MEQRRLFLWTRKEERGDIMMSPNEAIEVLRSLQNWLYLCSMNGGTRLQREAIDIAIACLEEKCHE